MRTAYLLVSHGSSDPRHQAGLEKLAQGVRQHLGRLSRSDASAAYKMVPAIASGNASHFFNTFPLKSRGYAYGATSDLPLVATATLEATAVPLSQQIEQFARASLHQGVRQVVIVPLFLLAGIHVREDLPREIEAAMQALPPTINLVCLPYIGSHGRFKHYVATRLAKSNVDRCVLLAHGSRRAAGNRAIQQLATVLNTEVAFWSVPPDLETRVYDLIQRGYQHIAIAPFFLFPGSITDAITRRTEELAEHFSTLSIRLLPPLGLSQELGKVVAELALTATPGLSVSPSRSHVSPSMTEKSITA